MNHRHEELRRLRKARPLDRYTRISLAILGAIMALSWIVGDFRLDWFTQRRWANFQRFASELWPFELRREDWTAGDLLGWVAGRLSEHGWEAAWTTLAISVAAITWAALFGALVAIPAARTLSRPEPFLPERGKAHAGARWGWRITRWAARLLLIFCRAIPEYVWAFLILALIGPSAWPAIVALGIHNSGILGKLGAEVVENLPQAPLAALRASGAGRLQIVLFGVFPLAFPRFLLFFFYRWETCVREATVLGMLGIVSLGFWIQDARARNHYDDMIFYVLIGAALVIVGDLISALSREIIRRHA